MILETLAAGLIVFLGSLLQSSFGYGLGVFAAPLLILLHPAWVPEPLLTASLLMTLLISWREIGDLAWRDLTFSLPGYLGGAITASLAIVVLPVRAAAAATGGLVLLGAGLSLLGVCPQTTPAALFGAGALSGLMSTIASVGGAPMALVYQNEEGSRVRSTLNGFFTIGTLLSLASLAGVGNYQLSDLLRALALLPGILLGFWASKRSLPNINQQFLQRGLIAVSSAAGLMIILRALLGG